MEWRKAKSYKIAKVSMPPGYSRERKHPYDDIAVVRLTEPITDPNVIPVCLPNKGVLSMTLSDQKATVAGWGSTRFRKSIVLHAFLFPSKRRHEVSVRWWYDIGLLVYTGGLHSHILKFLIAVPLISNASCESKLNRSVGRRFRKDFYRGITREILCAGFPGGGKDSCNVSGIFTDHSSKKFFFIHDPELVELPSI